MNKLAASEQVFAGATYDKLAEAPEQWPNIGQGDLYYGGSSYENTQGLGAHLALASNHDLTLYQGVSETLRPKEGELLAVPVTKLYDMGTTVAPAKLLESHIGLPSICLHPDTAAKLGISNGDQAQISMNGSTQPVNVKFDESISTGVVLVTRSFGFPISAPRAVAISAAEKAKGGY
jgi:NADH-quinone oxidoreductase subunit G